MFKIRKRKPSVCVKKYQMWEIIYHFLVNFYTLMLFEEKNAGMGIRKGFRDLVNYLYFSVSHATVTDHKV